MEDTPKVVMRGGFAPLQPVIRKGDPEWRHMLPEYPPQPNSFYELSSDGRVTERYFQNKKLVQLEIDKEASEQQSRQCSGSSSLMQFDKEGTNPERILVAQKPEQDQKRNTSVDNRSRGIDENRPRSRKATFSHLAKQPEHNNEFLEGWITTQKDRLRNPTAKIYNTLEENINNRKVREEEACENRKVLSPDTFDGQRNKLHGKLRAIRKVKSENIPLISTTIEDKGCFNHSRETAHFQQLPGSRSGFNSRTGRSKADLELALHRLIVDDEEPGLAAYSPVKEKPQFELSESVEGRSQFDEPTASVPNSLT